MQAAILLIATCTHKGVDTGGALGAEAPPRFSALHYILLGTVIEFYQILAFISLKPPKL